MADEFVCEAIGFSKNTSGYRHVSALFLICFLTRSLFISAVAVAIAVLDVGLVAPVQEICER